MQATQHVELATIDALIIDQHNAWHPEELSPDGWTDEWVLNVLLAPSRIRPRLQEAEVLKHWARAQR